jgi:hypothetical protein
LEEEAATPMMPEYAIYLLGLTAIGSIVDIIQFSWILKRGWRRVHRGYYNRVRRDVLADLGIQADRGKEEG